MSSLTEEQLRRVRQVVYAATGGRLVDFEIRKSDVELLAKRIDALDLADHACADEMLRWLLGRLKEDRKNQREWLADLLEQIRIAELQAMEADRAVEAVEALIAGELYAHGEAINQRWDAVEEDYRARGLLPPLAEAMPEPGPEPPSEVRAEPAPTPPEPEAGAPEAAPPVEPAAEPPPRSLGSLSYTQPGDPLTEKQERVFRAILAAAGDDWRATISQGRIAKASGQSQGGLWAHIDALERKDYLRVLDRGGSKSPAVYLICERARPAERPKTDAELVAEALAAGKVTKCPPAFVH